MINRCFVTRATIWNLIRLTHHLGLLIRHKNQLSKTLTKSYRESIRSFLNKSFHITIQNYIIPNLYNAIIYSFF